MVRVTLSVKLRQTHLYHSAQLKAEGTLVLYLRKFHTPFVAFTSLSLSSSFFFPFEHLCIHELFFIFISLSLFYFFFLIFFKRTYNLSLEYTFQIVSLSLSSSLKSYEKGDKERKKN